MTSSCERPLILVADPEPRTVDMIFTPDELTRLQALGRVVVHADGQRLGEAELEANLAAAEIVVGQINLPRQRLDCMPRHSEALRESCSRATEAEACARASWTSGGSSSQTRHSS